MLRTSCFIVVMLVALTWPARAQQASGSCVACHVRGAAPMPDAHRGEPWSTSAHATVGCQTCHGGDATAMHPSVAHRGVRDAVSPFSTINPANLSRTCAMCHSTIANAYRNTIHQVLLDAGDSRVPTCMTCHGAGVTVRPTPADAERMCAACHGPHSARAAYPAAMRTRIETTHVLQTRADALERSFQYLDDATRDSVAGVLGDARGLIAASLAAMHGGDPTTVDEQHAAAKTRLDTVDARLSAIIRNYR
ncbi:MAG TPA: multiheme c-type cytochrome [Vicinamibacterales bacterium]|nr:multiheme c-type cytochrome [Vicinamibacterales bacterium]